LSVRKRLPLFGNTPKEKEQNDQKDPMGYWDPEEHRIMDETL
jgi:hypothetical protein